MKKYFKFFANKGSYIVGLAIASLVGGLISAVALAAIPDGSGVIHGCYKNSTGALRVVDSESGGVCTNKETSLNWSIGNSSSSQIISNRIVLSAGDLTNEPLLNIPNLGQLVIEGCDINNGGALVYVNNTNHDVEFDRVTISPGQDSEIIANPTWQLPLPSVAAYTDSNGANYVATIEAPFQTTAQDCQFVGQAIISQN